MTFLPSLVWSSCGCVPQGTCHQDLSSPPALPSGETCLPSWEPCCLSPPSRTTLGPPSLAKKESKLSSCLPADLCQHLGSALASAPSCPNPGHVHCLLATHHRAHSSKTNPNPPHYVSKPTTVFDPFANQYLIVVPCLATCPGPTLTDSHLATPELFPPCRVGLKRCLLTLDLALLFAKTPIFQTTSIFNQVQEKAFMKDLHASAFDFASNAFAFVPAATTLKPGIATDPHPIFSTKSFPSYSTISPSTFNGASKSSAWLNHRQNLKAVKELSSFETPAGRKFFASLSSAKATKNPRHHHPEVLQSKSGPNSHARLALPKSPPKFGPKEAPAGYLQDLPEDDLVTVLEALKEAIDEVDVD